VTLHDQVQPMLSAYLDGELTQADAQRVRIHLEDCAECRRALEELGRVRELARDLRFVEPPEGKMDELENKVSVRAPRRLGWLLLILGLAGWTGYAAYLFVTDPATATWEKLLTGAVIIGGVLLLVSVLRQRLLELPHDRYRGVKR
jgi:predicted anti-sigma-YlaC factor YlaD